MSRKFRQIIQMGICSERRKEVEIPAVMAEQQVRVYNR
jgi:hypothetical protein